VTTSPTCSVSISCSLLLPKVRAPQLCPAQSMGAVSLLPLPSPILMEPLRFPECAVWSSPVSLGTPVSWTQSKYHSSLSPAIRKPVLTEHMPCVDSEQRPCSSVALSEPPNLIFEVCSRWRLACIRAPSLDSRVTNPES
jgi:hypothetical protein